MVQRRLFSDPALRVLEARYFLRDSNGKIIEEPKSFFRRVAHAVAAVDEGYWKKKSSERKKFFSKEFQEIFNVANSKELFVKKVESKFYKLLSELKFLPNSPTLMNAGKSKGQLSACFVLPIDDNLSAVFETLKNACLIHKSGGGTGFNFGHLRSYGSLVRSSGGIASGPMGFLKIFDQATNLIKQGGVRRGANMAILPINHPDIEAFITSKINGGIENFNISVGVTNSFMEALSKKKKWNLIEPKTKKIIKQIPAKDLWNLIIESAWKCGDPGVVFLDQIESKNPTPSIGILESTNPCGEQPLLPFESCNLGSVNLMAYVEGKQLNWNNLENDIPYMIRFLDNIIDANSYPLIETEEITLKNRKIGLGVMGWADVLMSLEIPYDSDTARAFGKQIMKKISEVSLLTTQLLAKEKGAFSGFQNSRWAHLGQSPRRNATVTTVAPTGTISIIAQVSSGIEPVFSLAHERVALDGHRFSFFHPKLDEVLEKYDLKKSKKVMNSILRTGSVQGVIEIPKNVRRYMKNSLEIKYLDHIKMQACFQEHTENGVSKTINLSKDATELDIKKSYEFAYLSHCKGITVYRDASKPHQVLYRGIKHKPLK